MKRGMLRWGLAATAAAVAVSCWFLLGGAPPPVPRGPLAEAGPGRPAPAPPPRTEEPGTPVDEAPADPEPLPAPAEPEAPSPVLLEGQVVGILDEGVAGASVGLFACADAAGGTTGTEEEILLGRVRVETPLKIAVTGEDGAFSIPVPRGVLVTVVASAADHAPARLEGVVLEETRRGVVLRLGTAATVAGRVLGEATEGSRRGRPVEGALVTLASGDDGGGRKQVLRILATARSDAEGAFRFTEVPPDAGHGKRGARLFATLEGWVPAATETEVPSDRAVLVLGSPTWGKLSGVVEQLGDRPLGGPIRVRAETHPWRFPVPMDADVTTDADGLFEFPRLAVNPDGSPTPVTIEVLQNGRAWGGARFTDWDGKGPRRKVFVHPWPDGVLAGRLVAEGRGVPGVEVGAIDSWEPVPRGPVLPLKVSARTDRSGRFSLAGLDGAGVSLRVDPVRQRWRIARDAEFALPARPASGAWTVDVPVEAVPPPRKGAPGADPGAPAGPDEAVIRGCVQDAEFSPIRSARVSGWGPVAVLTDERGMFVLRGAYPGQHVQVTLVATATGFEPARAGPFDVVGSGETPAVGIVMGGKLAPIRGRVFAADGAPAAGATVFLGAAGKPATASSRFPGAIATYTRADGVFRFDVRAGTEWSLAAERAGFSASIARVVAGGDVPDLVLGTVPGRR